jgi:hypothetical protein
VAGASISVARASHSAQVRALQVIRISVRIPSCSNAQSMGRENRSQHIKKRLPYPDLQFQIAAKLPGSNFNRRALRAPFIPLS